VYDFEDEELDHLFQGKRRMTLKEMQQTEKEILRYVDDLCRRKHLRYWVCGGTLLGTIRHKGFIPWDDDIDIFLPWKDYLRFIEVFEENERYAMFGMGTSEVNEFSDIFARVACKETIIDEDIGTVRRVNHVWLDVFPLVGLPEDDGERKLFFKKYQEVNRRIWEDFYASNGSLDVFPKWYPKQKEFLEKYDFDRSEYVGVLGTAYGDKDSTTNKVYSDTLRAPFEDIEVNIPVGYKEYLDHLYGSDWMQLPEESKRKSLHEIKAYWM
jgi:lipopolysaccharide cholinephosphotransferase